MSQDSSKLDHWVNAVDKAHLTLATISNGLKVLVFSVTIVLLWCRHCQTKPDERRNFSRSVPIQLVLLLASAMAYFATNII